MSNIILKAAQFAKEAHEGQVRKYTGKPYITHPARVAARTMLLDNTNEDIVCAAWLHDTVEDCEVTLDDIDKLFGPSVRNLIWELTNPSKGKYAPRAERKEMDRRHLRLVSDEAKHIKLLDRLDNIEECMHGAYDLDWCMLYVKESNLLLNEALKDVCPVLEKELSVAIYALGQEIGCEP